MTAATWLDAALVLVGIVTSAVALLIVILTAAASRHDRPLPPPERKSLDT